MFQMIIFFYNVTDYKKYLQIYLTKTCKVDKSIKKILMMNFCMLSYMYMDIYVCVYVHIFIYTHTYNHTHIHTRVCDAHA